MLSLHQESSRDMDVVVLLVSVLTHVLNSLMPHTLYRKIQKISPRAYIFRRPFLRGLFLEGLIYGGKFAFQNRLG